MIRHKQSPHQLRDKQYVLPRHKFMQMKSSLNWDRAWALFAGEVGFREYPLCKIRRKK